MNGVTIIGSIAIHLDCAVSLANNLRVYRKLIRAFCGWGQQIDTALPFTLSIRDSNRKIRMI